MKNIQTTKKFSTKAASILIAVCVVFSILIPAVDAQSCTTCTCDWYDSGWIYLNDSRFQADEKMTSCVNLDYPFALMWSQQGGYHAWFNGNVPEGDYKIDMKIGYSHKTGTAPQTNETMRVYTGTNYNGLIPPSNYTDKANVPDFGDDIVDSYENIAGCLDVLSAIQPYSNVTGRTMHFPQNGDLAIQATGESLMLYAIRIYGCKKEEPQYPNLSINKEVRNITQGSSWSNSVNADPSDEVEFRITVSNTGNGDLTNVRAWDSLPYKLDYISGSTKVNGSYFSDGIISGGINLGDIGPNGEKTIVFKSKVLSE
ncbi:MAG: DUF11 domain-containing protein, partial [Candidatus Portnoybacteria bacterium]|nr:DUF11 domain-containing protein [Candidatus Portnoybacteria bacterium]